MSKLRKIDIYYLFWLLIHSIISFILLITKYIHKMTKFEKYDHKDINQLVNQLKKIPKHIAICINEDIFDGQQVSDLIRWCEQFGIAYMSLFSDNDLLIRCKELIHHLSHPKNGYKSLKESGEHQKNGYNKRQSNGFIGNNGLINFENIKICVVSYEDSHQSIVKAAKHLSNRKEDIIQNDVSEYLKRTFNFPDPELMISFGSSPSVYGYPIWQIRLTEMYFITSHLDFNFDDFYKVLTKYSKCEQRLGK